MSEALRPLWMMFYAPVRGMREVRESAPLGSAILLAFIAQIVRGVLSAIGSPSALIASRELALNLAQNFFGIIGSAVMPILLLLVVFTPITILVANLFDRRARFALALQQEFSSVASALLYAWTAASLITIPLAIVAHLIGIDAAARQTFMQFQQVQETMRPDEPPPPEAVALAFTLLRQVMLLVALSPFAPFVVWLFLAVRELFRLTIWRTIGVVILSGILMLPATAAFAWLMMKALGSPLILLLLFWLLRGYFGELVQTGRARAAFKQNLESATLNPADASAHYNLGLLHLQRKELDAARERFQRAIEIDSEEIDSHYQLGRIARAQGRLADAIAHFNEVVGRDTQHAQHEIWREVGATYLAAGQFEDARHALGKFLRERPNDAEGLYLMGRALAGLGRRREAAEAMRACIEAVKTAPAYKYRAEKHWMSEAQQFLRSQA